MPKKKKVVKEIPAPTFKEDVEISKHAEAAEICGHQNAHYTAGVLTCQMDKTHTGLHSAFLNGNPTFWSDAAGTPVRKHA